MEHIYSVTTCPECGADLTATNAVLITASGNDGQSLGEFSTALSNKGLLLNDTAGMIAGGFHSGTECAQCGELLDDFEC